MNYETRTISVLVSPDGHETFSQYATQISIVDEGSGEFLEIEQHGRTDVGKIQIDKNEWPAIRDAIEKMMQECRP